MQLVRWSRRDPFGRLVRPGQYVILGSRPAVPGPAPHLEHPLALIGLVLIRPASEATATRPEPAPSSPAPDPAPEAPSLEDPWPEDPPPAPKASPKRKRKP